MSKCLTLLASTSRHPALMDDAAARDVLWWLADLAHDRNGGRIYPSKKELARDTGRSEGQVRRTIDRLVEAGILVDTGERVGRDVAVYTIDENELEKFAPSGRASRRAQSGITKSTAPRPRHDRATTAPRPRHDRATTAPPMGGDKQELELKLEQEQENTKNAGVPGGASEETAKPVLAARSQPTLEPLAPVEPATAEATAAEARVQSAVDALLPDLREYHLAKSGMTASGRIVAGWLEKLPTRLADDGVTAERIDARVVGIRAVLRWWRLPSEADAQPGEPFCFYDAGTRHVSKMLDNAKHLDKLIGWAAAPRRKPGTTSWGPAPAVKRTRGGVELGAPRYELDTNPDGSERW